MLYSIIAILIFLIPLILCPKPRKHTMTHYDCILVLGCPTYDDGKLTPSLKRRIHTASTLYQNHHADCFILSGGTVKNQFCEAEAMKNELKKSCPYAFYILECQAKNTYENFKYSKLLCEQNKLHKIAIVSDKTHLRRSAFFARQFFQEFDFYGTQEPFSVKKRVREYFALYLTLYYEIKLKSKE